MNRELIKSELISEVDSLLSLAENKMKDVSGFEKFNAVGDHIGKADEFSKTIIDKLNEILEKHNVEFVNEDDKTDFISFINPTIRELIGKYILNQ